MEIFFDFGSDLKHKLLVGNNKLTDEYYINVQEVYTFVIGTCYVIKSNVPIPPPVFLKITLEFNDTMNEVDLPKVNLPTQFCNLQGSRALAFLLWATLQGGGSTGGGRACREQCLRWMGVGMGGQPVFRGENT